MNAAGDNFSHREDVGNILTGLDSYVQPGPLFRIYRQVDKFSRYERTDQTMERYLLEFDVLRGEVGARAIGCVAPPDAPVSVSRMRNAALPKNGKSLLLACPFCTEADASVIWTLRRRGQAKCPCSNGFGSGHG